MTEVPEYLLERSRARRAALGLGGGGDAPAEGSSPPSETTPSPVGTGAATPAAAAAPAAPAAPAAAPAPATPTYVEPPGPKSGIPTWMMPVILILPLWAIVYMGSFGETQSAEAGVSGAEVFQSAGCVNCHGADGQGGVGPQLSEGEVVLTFPEEADHVAFVIEGSSGIQGEPYGDPNRGGGQQIASSGGMPGFGDTLSEEEIAAVVAFEREGL